MAGQTQCPKCGGFRVKRTEGFTFLLAVVIGIVSGFGLGLLLTLPGYVIYKLFEGDEGREWHQYGHECAICGYKWLQRPGDVLPMTDDPELRRKGVKLLEDQQSAAAYYQQQRRK